MIEMNGGTEETKVGEEEREEETRFSSFILLHFYCLIMIMIIFTID